MAAAVPIGGVDPGVVRAGACAAWPLPPDERGAGFARAVVKAVCAELRMPATAAYDASVALSELATNVYLHAYGGRGATAPPSVPGAPGRLRCVVHGGLGGLPELWAYVRWRPRGAPGGRWEPEIVFTVYDAAPWRGPTPAEAVATPSPVYAEAGRGFRLVGALAAEYGGGWGVHRTRSRLGPAPVPGKAVYFTMPVPACTVPPRSGTVPAVAAEIRDMLAARGIGPLQMSADRDIAVICVRAGTHVWVRERFIHCRLSGPEAARHAPYDRIEVVERVVRHCADQDAERSQAGAGSAQPWAK